MAIDHNVYAVDIVNAIKYPELIKDSFFADSSVKISENEKNGYGGAFSQVFPFIKDGKKLAFKVWYKEIENNENRYVKILSHLKKCNLPYFVDCIYVKDGIFVKGQFLDTCRMEWVEGYKLIEYISYHLRNPKLLKKLSDNFLLMINKLRNNSISHGDLQHDNIFVTTDGKIKLIDYDSICVPGISGENSSCRGRIGYQHPWRYTSRESISSFKIDYFSELVIYLTITAIIENPLLWDQYNVVQAERLLFTDEDFYNFKDSKIKRDLYLLSPKVQKLTKTLENYLAAHANFVPFNFRRRDVLMSIISSFFKKR